MYVREEVYKGGKTHARRTTQVEGSTRKRQRSKHKDKVTE